MTRSFLLIGTAKESMWPLVLEQAIAPLGNLRLVSHSQVEQAANEHAYDAIIIDMGAVPNPIELITCLHVKQPQARIIAATASPTWQRAREVLQAGATDYIRKSLDKARLQSKIQRILADAPQST